VIDHLEKSHSFDCEGNQKGTAKRRKPNDLQHVWSQQQQVHNSIFDEKGWKQAYIRWVVCSSISLCEVSSQYHNELLAYQNPRVEGILPSSHSTTSNWITQAYKDARPKVS
jgi:hypothetical protein